MIWSLHNTTLRVRHEGCEESEEFSAIMAEDGVSLADLLDGLDKERELT